MPTFLDQLSTYNAKASLAITEAVKQENADKANLMSALKSTANDLNLSSTIRLNALTALINIGDLLELALPPYFPLTVTYENLQKYAGIHNDLDGLDQGNYQHLTVQEKATLFSKASISDVTWGNLQGDYTQNIAFAALFNQKQQQLNGVGLVRMSGTSITYDNATYLTSTTFASTAAGGGLTGFYPNPSLSNNAVITQAITGFDPLGAAGSITPADTIVSAIQKLNANILAVSAATGTINSISFAMPSNLFNYTAGPYTSGAAALSATLKTQSQNTVFAGPISGGVAQPDFRALIAADLPASGTPTGTFGSSITIPVITVDTYGRVTNISNVASASGGQVNTVTFSVPGGGVFSAINGGTPTDVQIGLGLGLQTANTVWAGPTTGAAAAPGFRALTATDIPTGIPQANISGLAASLATKLSAGLNTTLIYMGNGSGVAAQSVVGGDLTALYSEPNNVNTASFTINNGAVTYAKFASVPDSALNTIRPILLGRFSAGQGVMEQLTLSGDFTLNAVTGEIGLLTPNPPALNDAGDLLTSSGANILQKLSLPVDYATKGYLLTPYVGTTAPDIKLMWGEVGGDITYSINTTATPFPEFLIGANKVTLGKIATIASNTILGNIAGGAASPTALTPANVVSMLPLQDPITGLTQGVVPASAFTPAVGKTKQDYFLSANNTWELGGGGTTTNALTIGSGLAPKTTPLTTFDGSAAVTISLNMANINTWTARQEFTNASGIYLGEPATSSGNIRFRGFTSGYVNFSVANITANQSYIYPTLNGVSGQYLKLVDAVTGQLEWDSAIGVTSQSLSNGNGILSFIFDGSAGATVEIDTSVVATLTDTQILTNKTLSTGAAIDAVPGVTAKGDMWYSNDAVGTLAILGNPGAAKWLSFDTGLNTPIWTALPSLPSTTNPASQYSVPYYSAAGTSDVLDGLAAPVVNGAYFLCSMPLAAVAVPPIWRGSTGVVGANVVLDDTPTIKQPIIGTGAGNGHLHIRRGSIPGGVSNYSTLAFLSASKTMSIEFSADGWQSEFLFAAATATKTYTFPNESGTVVLNAFKTISDGTSSFSASGSDTLTLKSDGTYIAANYDTGAKSVSMDWQGPDLLPPVGAGANMAIWDSGNIGSTTITSGTVVGVTVLGAFTSSTTTLAQLNYLAGASGTTGSNALVFGSSPTITNPTITAITLTATSSATTPALKFTGTGFGNMTTTAQAGAMEYDSTVPFFSIKDSTRGVLRAEQNVFLVTPYTLTSQTAAQKLFNATTNGAVTVPTGTFEFECFFVLTSMSASSGSFGFALGGTAGLAGQNWVSQAQKGTATLTTATAIQMTYNTAAANTAIATASVNTTGYAYIRGVVRINSTGTLIPQVSLGIAAAAIVGAGSYFKIFPLNTTNSTNFNTGNWS